MALMIPNCGPAPTESRGEPQIYQLLKEQLSEDFTVIHSLPWLCAAVREISGTNGVTGEIDFLILHPVMGVLALEVKGGVHKIEGLAFVHVRSGTRTRVIEQTRASVHGLARWLGVQPSLRIKIGYALAFPHSDFQDQIVSTALADMTVQPPAMIVIDKGDLPYIGRRIFEIMNYWKQALSNPPIGRERMKALVETLCPSFDGTPKWGDRVAWDRDIWLRLTPEQSTVVNDAISDHRMVVTGWPGTGKTLILIECARRLLAQGKSVLVLTFNSLLAQHIDRQIGASPQVTVRTWHSFCSRGLAPRNVTMVERDRDWLDRRCLEDLDRSLASGGIRRVDVVLVDEAQAFKTEWFTWLCEWHGRSQLLAFCDETQVFSFEEDRIALSKLCEKVGSHRPFELTSVLRSPRAVFQRLKQVRRPEVQLHTPRELEVDALEELLVVGMDDALIQTLSRLEKTGVLNSDIVVLNKFGKDRESAPDLPVRCDTVSRFRGLESPVIIIRNAEQMDDTELFCAYSRSTSLCIAIYDAELLGARGAGSQMQSLVLSEPGNAASAERAWRHAYAGELVCQNLTVTWFNLRSVELGWIKEWNSWALVLKDVLAPYWIDYLASHYRWNIYFWDKSDLRRARRCSPVKDVGTESPGDLACALLPCESCAMMTPQKLDFQISESVWICDICNPALGSEPNFPDDVVIDALRALDSLLVVENPRTMSKQDRKSLPISLAAGMSIRFAEKTVMPHPIGIERITSGRVSYHAALGFVYALINLLAQGDRIEVANVATDLYNRYLVPSGLTLEKWKQDFALACSIAFRYQHLRKLEKGVYVARAGWFENAGEAPSGVNHYVNDQ